MNQNLFHFFYSLKPHVWITGAVLLSTALATIHLGHRSFWWDEAYSVYFAHMEWSKLWELITQGEANQALYYILLKLWVSFGDNEFTVRLLSAIFSAASVPIMYLVGKELIDSRAGIIAAFLLGVNGFFIYYAQEARGYSMLLFLTLCSSYFAIRCIKSPTWKSWAGFILFSTIATYVHFFAIWVMLAHACSLPFLPRNQVKWKGILLASVTIVICLLPLLLFILSHDKGQIAWILKPTYRDIAYLIYSFVGWPVHMVGFKIGFIYACIYFFLCIIPIKYLVLSIKENGFSFKTWSQVFIAGWFFLPIIFVYCASMYKPMFQTHYLIIALPGFILLTTTTLTKIDRKWVSLLASLVLIITTTGFTLTSYNNFKKEDWRGIVKTIESLSTDQDAFLFFRKEARVPFDYYLNRFNKTSKTFHYSNSFKPYLEMTDQLEINEALIKQISQRHQRLWLILSHSERHPNVQSIKSLLDKYFIEKKFWRFDIQIYVHFYVSKEN